ncbi:MAG TPA: SAM-dependent methyltransferase, partial [Myxococcota bacterium]|nr:SAM-dependent methyltransferase [Myxococcota bacterium]
SVVAPAVRRGWRHVLSRFPGGKGLPPEDKRPPARAHLKLSEALLHLGRAPRSGESCVDLGSAPGSWAWVALQRGAAVTAVDRSPLRDDLMAHPRLTFVRGDAFKFAPAAPVDWLVCDIIAFPERSIELLDRWLAEGWCKRFVVTLKFKGDADYPKVDACKAVLAARGARFGMRQLYNNKNEVTVYGAART